MNIVVIIIIEAYFLWDGASFMKELTKFYNQLSTYDINFLTISAKFLNPNQGNYDKIRLAIILEGQLEKHHHQWRMDVADSWSKH